MVSHRGSDNLSGGLNVERVSPNVARIAVPTPTLAPYYETNTYVVFSQAHAVVVDCGTESPEGASQVARALWDMDIRRVDAYIATHHHVDHTQGLRLLSAVIPGPIYVHETDHALAMTHLDPSVATLKMTERTMAVGDVEIDILHRPGHTHGHVHLLVRPDNVLMVGDHMAGQGSVWIGPPDGHMADYYTSLESIIEANPALALPGHGDIIRNPSQASRALWDRRLERERQIVDVLSQRSCAIDEIVEYLYRGRELGSALEFAKRTTLAHVQHLLEHKTLTQTCSPPDYTIRYHRNLEEESLT